MSACAKTGAPSCTHISARVLLLMDREEEARDQIVPRMAHPEALARLRHRSDALLRLPLRDARPVVCLHARSQGPQGPAYRMPGSSRLTSSPMLDHVRPRLAEEDYSFLSTLADALSDRQSLHGLNDLLLWRNTEPDRGWYRRYSAGAASGIGSSVETANQDPGQSTDQSRINSDDIPFQLPERGPAHAAQPQPTARR